RLAATIVLLGGVAASNFINPPYPFPFEDNLAFVDFLKLHREAAEYIARSYADPVVQTAWPLSAELSRPELGFSPRPIRVGTLPDFTPGTVAGIDWSKVQIVVVFSRKWDSGTRFLPFKGLAAWWERLYDYVPDVTPDEARSRLPFPPAAS